MQASDKSTSRKKFLKWSALLLGSATVLKFVLPKEAPKEKKETIKMLTEDGRLVEIDKDLLTAASKKITNDELKEWVKK